MAKVEINKAGIEAIHENIGNQVRQIVTDTVTEATDLPTDEAAALLHQRLNAVGGLTLDRAWSVNAVETLRRGDDFAIKIR